jgi:hypothetical protein
MGMLMDKLLYDIKTYNQFWLAHDAAKDKDKDQSKQQLL